MLSYGIFCLRPIALKLKITTDLIMLSKKLDGTNPLSPIFLDITRNFLEIRSKMSEKHPETTGGAKRRRLIE